MSAAQESPVRVRTENGITTLTLNQPERRNSLSMAMLEGLSSALERIAHDDSSRVVVLASAGNVFCAGHDLREMREKFDSHEFQLALFQQCSKEIGRASCRERVEIAVGAVALTNKKRGRHTRMVD